MRYNGKIVTVFFGVESVAAAVRAYIDENNVLVVEKIEDGEEQ